MKKTIQSITIMCIIKNFINNTDDCYVHMYKCISNMYIFLWLDAIRGKVFLFVLKKGPRTKNITMT